MRYPGKSIRNQSGSRDLSEIVANYQTKCLELESKL